MPASISGFGLFSEIAQQRSQPALTAEQISQVQSILEQFDPESLTTEDAVAINDAFREAGIRPSRELRDIVEAAGFDPQQLREAGNSDGTRGPRGRGRGGFSVEIRVDALEELRDVLNGFNLTELSEDDENDLVSQLTEAGFFRSGTIVDVLA